MSGVRASFSGETLDLVAAAQGWRGVPVRCDENPIGLLWLEHGQPGFLTEDHARLAIGFAEMAALAIRSERINQRALQVTALEERQKLARDLHDSVRRPCIVSCWGHVQGKPKWRAHIPCRHSRPWTSCSPRPKLHSLTCVSDLRVSARCLGHRGPDTGYRTPAR